MYLAKLNWREAAEVLKKDGLVALIPVGSTEQHGPIGPLGTDFIIPEHFARRIEKQTEVLVVPTMPFGIASHHVSFPGTIDIGYEGLYLVIKGILQNLSLHGVKKFIFLNGHGGNSPALDRAALEAARGGCLCAQLDWWSLAPLLNPDWKTGHGDGQEAAMVMAIDETIVNKDMLVKTNVSHLSPRLTSAHLNAVNFRGIPVKIIRDVRAVADTGGFGGLDSSAASKQWGEAMEKALLEYMIAFIEEFKSL